MRKIPTILFAIVLGLMLATPAWAQQKSFVISETDLNLTEGGMFSFSVRLASQPTGDVTVTVEPVQDVLLEVNTSIITNGVENTDKTSTLTFTTSNWNEDRTITLFSRRDSDSKDESTHVNLSASGGGFDDATGKVMVSVMDADASGLVISDKWLGYSYFIKNIFQSFLDRENAEEFRKAIRKGEYPIVQYKSGTSEQIRSFTVKLASKPKAGSRTTVEAISNSPTWIRVAPKVHEWTPEQWNQDKTFTILPSLDNPTDGQLKQQSDEVGQILLVRRIKDDDTQGSDQGVYQGTGIIDIDLVEFRNATGGVTLLSSSARLSAGSVGTAALSMVGKDNLFGNWIDIEASIPNEDQSRLDIVGSTKHRYYRQNDGHHLFRNFKFRAKEDADIDNDIARVRFDVEEQQDGDAQYRVAKPIVYVYIEDRTIPSLQITRDAPTEHPGNPVETGTATIKVKLSAAPALTTLGGIPGRTSVSVDSSNPSLLTISPAVLEFTRDNWNQDQTFTLSGVDDIDALNEVVKLKFVATGGRFDEASGGPVDVEVTDTFSVFDDDATFVLSKSTLTIDEGGNGSLKVRLKGRPSGNVDVALSGSDIGAMTVSPARLTFTRSNWNMDQPVTVSGVQDLDAVDERVHLILGASGAHEFEGKQSAALIEVDDDEVANLTVTPTTLTITEGSEKTFTVSLTSEPSDDVTLNLGQNGTTNPDITIDTDSDTAGNQNTLLFTSSNWSAAQTVSVRAAEDDDIANDSASISITSSGGNYGNLTGSLVVDVIDNDNAGMTISTNHLKIAEGESDGFTVVLTTRPSANVTVDLTSSNSDVTADTDTATAGNQTTLTFTASNWSTAQSVWVSAAEDDDGLPDSATLSIRSKSADTNYNSIVKLVSVSVRDKTPPDLVVSVTKVDITEGGSGHFMVRLATQPSVDTTVSVDPISNSDISADADSSQPGNQNTVTFTPSNWNTQRRITLHAGEDDDGADESVDVSLAASGGEYENVTSDSVRINISDNDTRNLSISACTSTECNLTLDEGGSASFTVALTTRPVGGDVAVRIRFLQNSGMSVDTDTNQSGDQSGLTFTSTNWKSPQTVTVSAPEKDDSNTDFTDTVWMSTSGADYNQSPDGGSYGGSVLVKAIDNDRGLVVSPKSIDLDEGDHIGFSVKLKSRPRNGNVTVNLRSSRSDVTLDTDANTNGNQTTLTFTRLNWNSARSVVVRALDDDDNNDYKKVADISLSASGGDYGTGDITESVKVTVTDDDVLERLIGDPSRLTVVEGGSAQFGVTLSTEPSGPVAVTLTSSASEVTLSPTSLNFTDSNWDTAQAVTVSAAEDSDSEYETAVLSLSASGSDYATATGKVDVTVSDNDYFIVDTIVAGQVEINEGLSKTLTVKLARQPSVAGVIANIDHRPPFSNRDVTVTPRILTFTSSNWDTTQRLTLTSVQDGDADDDMGTVAIRSVDSQFTRSVKLRVNDDESVDLQISERSLTLIEGGSQKTFTVRLRSQPSDDVTLTLTRNNADVTIDKTELTFTAGNWTQTQLVTVSAVKDNDSADDSATIAIAASGGGYANKTASVTIAITDIDTIGLVLSDTTLSIEEGAAGEFFTVKLGTRPTATVTVDLTFDRPDTGQNNRFYTMHFSPDTLTFTGDDWNSPQAVTVTANDDDDASAELDTINLTAKGGDYAGKTAGVEVTVKDDDTISLAIEAAADPLTVAEGGHQTFTVKLATQPSANVTVTLTQPTNTDVRVDTDPGTTGNQTALAFTTTDWNTKRVVTVSAGQDDDDDDDNASVALTAAGGDYANIVGSVSIKVNDDDTPSLSLSPNPLNITEGESGGFDVTLATKPSANVTVTLAQPTDPDVSVDRTSLTFTGTNWNTPQRVNASAAQDDDTTNDEASVSLTASGGGYANVSAGMTIEVTDDDSAGLTLSPTRLTVNEGRQGSFTVRLAKQPTGDVTVNVAQSGTANPDVTLDTDTSAAGNQTSLTFTSDNWNTPRTVTVSAGEDDDAANDNADISLATSGATEYGSVTGAISITVRDNDNAALTIVADAEPLAVTEGGNKTFTLQLSTPPSANVSVSLSQSGTANPDVTFDTDTATPGNQNSLTFTSDNWNIPRTIRVSASDDQDATDESASIDLTASGVEYDGVNRILSVAVSDNDAASLVISASSLTIAEGNSATFTVNLMTRPSADVTVRLRQRGTPNEDVVLDKAILTFTSADWDSPQTVTVSANEENDDAVNDEVIIDLTALGSGYDDTGNVTITVTDNDEVGLTLSSNVVNVSEGGSRTFTVKLASRPATDGVIDLTSNSAEVTLSPTTLSYDLNNWNDERTVTVSAANDSDSADDPAKIDLTGIGLLPSSVTVTTMEIIDAFRNRNFVIADEGTSTATFTYVLESRPDNDRTIAASTDHADLKIATGTDTPSRKLTLTFTPDNWNTPQVINISVAQDSDTVDRDQHVQFTLGPGLAHKSGVGNEMDVLMRDDDVTLTLSDTSLTVTEGGSATFKVKLGTRPSRDRSVSLASSNTRITIDTDPDTAGNQTTLAFTNNDWNDEQEVTVSATDDSDTLDNTAAATITLGGEGLTAASVSVNTAESIDAYRSNNYIEVAEGLTTAFYYVLRSQPPGNRTIELSTSHDELKIATNGGAPGRTLTLEFTPDNWNTRQEVMVSTTKDDDSSNRTEYVHSALGPGLVHESGVDYRLRVLIRDPDIGLTLTPASLEVAEGTSGTFTVKPATQPTSDLTIALASSDTSSPDITFSPASLTFTTANWNNPRTVTVNTVADSDTNDDSATINLSGTGVALTSMVITARERVGLVLSTTNIAVIEGNSETFTVKLGSQPADSRTIDVVSDDLNHATVSPASLTFTPDNWNDTQTVTVNTIADSGPNDDGLDDIASITLSGDESTEATVTVGVLEAIEAYRSRNYIEAIEGGSTETFTYVLRSRPLAKYPRTIALETTHADLKIATGDATPSQNLTLTFNKDNWNTPRTIKISIAHDNDADNRNEYINTTLGLGLVHVSGVSNRARVLLKDDDVGLSFNRTSLNIDEGESGSFTVKLAKQPPSKTGDRTVTLTSNSAGSPDITFSPTSLTFTGGDDGNWNTAQIVRVQTVADADTVDDSKTINLGGTGIVSGSMVVTAKESGVGLTLSDTSLVVTEGLSAEFKVKLDSQPPGDRIVHFASNNNTISFSPSRLTFTDGNWNTDQSVSVSATKDTDILDNSGTITLSGVGIGESTMNLTVMEGIEATRNRNSIVVDEGTSDSDFTYVLDRRPPSDRTIEMTTPHADLTIALVGSDNNANLTFARTLRLTFTPDNWNTAQRIKIKVADDADKTDRIEIFYFDLGPGVVHSDTVFRGMQALLRDNDIEIILSDSSPVIVKGDSVTLKIRLGSTLSETSYGNRTVNLTSNNSDITLNPTSLEFTRNNWNTTQDVTLTAAANIVSEGTAKIVFSGDALKTAEATVDVRGSIDAIRADTNDNENLNTIGIDEGASKDFTYVLESRPSGDRTITMMTSHADILVATDDGTPSRNLTLTFTENNWDQEQTVTISAAEDADTANLSANIDFDLDTGLEHKSGTNDALVVNVQDDDVNLTLAPTSLDFSEGSDGAFTVKLARQPPGKDNRTITLTSDGAGSPDITFSPASLTFTGGDDGNWNTAQTVRVETTADADTTDDYKTINLAGTGIVSSSLAVSAKEVIGLTLSRTSLTTTEGRSKTFTVKPASEPSGSRTIDLASSNPAITIDTDPNTTGDQTTLTFTGGNGGNWNSARTVTIKAAVDSNDSDDTSTIDLTGAGITAAQVSVLALESIDVIRFYNSQIVVLEGNRRNFFIRLKRQPDRNRTIKLVSSNDDMLLGPGIEAKQIYLTIEPARWNSTTIVGVFAKQDADSTDQNESITITGEGIAETSISVSVRDDDNPSMILSKSSSTLSEGGTDTFTVKLAERPSDDTVISLTSDNSDITMNSTSLTFTSGNWNTAQEVTISAATDSDSIDDTATIGLSGSDVIDTSISVNALEIIDANRDRNFIIVDEGTSKDAFYYVLDSRPTGNRTIDIETGHADLMVATGTGTWSRSLTLTFTPDNWDQRQTVKVSAAQDTDATEREETINFTLGPGLAHKSGGAASSGVSATLRTFIREDDITIVLSDTQLKMDEGDSGEFTVKLSSMPLLNRTIDLTSTNPDITLNPTSLTFTGGDDGNWNTVQKVTITSATDNDAQDDTATITLAGDGFADATVGAAIFEIIEARRSKNYIEVAEGTSTETFTYVLESRPTTNRTIVLQTSHADLTIATGSDDANRSFNRSLTLTFTDQNWDQPQTVTMKVVHDDDATDRTEYVNFTLGSGLVHKSGSYWRLAVALKDDDVALTLSPTSLNLGDGLSGSFNVKLAKQPPGKDNKTITLTSNNTKLTIYDTDFVTPGDQNTLTFIGADNGNWNTFQLVDFQTARDNDTTDDTITITLEGPGVETATLTVNVNENVDLMLSSTKLRIVEGNSDDVKVKLTSQPNNDRTIKIRSLDSDLTSNPSSLTFTNDNWNVEQTLTVSVAVDNDDSEKSGRLVLSGDGVALTQITVDMLDSLTIVRNKDITRDKNAFEVNEGTPQGTVLAEETFTYVMKSAPLFDRTVKMKTTDAGLTLSNVSAGDTTSSTDLTLNFTNANWNQARTIRLHAAHDADAAENTEYVDITLGDGLVHESGTNDRLSVTIKDDDIALTLAPTSLDLNNGGTGNFTVKLAKQPPGKDNKTIILTSNNADLTIDDTDPLTSGKQNTLTFTGADGGNWDTPQTVNVTSTANEADADESTTITLEGTGVGTASLTAISKNPIEAVSNPTTLTVKEGGTETFTVRLNSRPGSDHRAMDLASDNDDITLSPSSVTFAGPNWSVPQTVTITAAADSDTLDDETTIEITGIGIESASLPLTVQEVDDIDLVLSRDSWSMLESDSGTFTVKLAMEPAGDRTVALNSANSNITLSPTSLTFTGGSDGNWNSPQTVTVSASADDNALDDSATITLTGNGVNNDDVIVTLFEATTIEAERSVNTVSAIEGSSTATFTYVLKAQPPGNRKINLRSSHSDLKISIGNNTPGDSLTLTFTRDNWNQARTVKITVEHDDDGTDRTEYIDSTLDLGLAHSSGVNQRLEVSITDDDVALTVDKTRLEVTSDGSEWEFTVKLAKQPPGKDNRSITLTSNDTDLVTINDTDPDTAGNQNTLTFTGADNGNWNTAQKVKVTALADTDTTDDDTTISLTGTNIISHSLPVAAKEPIGLTLSLASIDNLHTNPNQSFTVRLASKPETDRKVKMTIPVDGFGFTGQRKSSLVSQIRFDTDPDTSGNQDTLTFTGGDDGNWDSPQTVTISSNFRTYTDFEHHFLLSGAGITPTDLDFNVDPFLYNRIVSRSVDSSNSLALYEGTSTTFTMSLNLEIYTDRSIELETTGDNLKLSTGDDTPSRKITVTFSPDDDSLTKTIKITSEHDSDGGDDIEYIDTKLDTAMRYGQQLEYGKAPPRLKISIQDDDVGLTLVPTPLELEEGTQNVNGTFTVKLSEQPPKKDSRTITLAVNGTDNPDIAFSPTTLQFTGGDSGNWNTAQNVRVTAGPDSDSIDDIETIALTGSGIVSTSLVASVLENIALDLSDVPLRLAENTSGTFKVKLARQPSLERRVNLTTNDTDIEIDTDPDTFGNQSVLTFTGGSGGNWNTPQTVTVTASQDSNHSDDTLSVDLAGTGIDDHLEDVSVWESISIDRSHDSLVMDEGSTTTFTVSLKKRPDNDRTIVMESSYADIGLSTGGSPSTQISLTFTSTNWNVGRTITVSAAQDDDDQADHDEHIDFTGFGLAYNDLVDISKIGVTVRDDDLVRTVLSTSSLNLTEGGSATFTVKLNRQPSVDRIVSLASDNSDITLSPTSLTFTGGSNGNWNTAQTVTLSAATDSDAVDDAAVINLTGTGFRGGSLNARVFEAIGVTLSASTLAVTEGGSGTFTVKLDLALNRDRTVNLTSSDSGVTIDTDPDTPGNQTALTFKPDNWDIPQSVRVDVAADSNDDDSSATINLSGLGIAAADATVNTREPIEIDRSLGYLTVDKGSSSTFTIALKKRPDNDRTIVMESTHADIKLSTGGGTPSTLLSVTFTTANWNTDQTVTVARAAASTTRNEYIDFTGVGLAPTTRLEVALSADAVLFLSDPSLIIGEGKSDTFTVRLVSQPTGDVTVTLSQKGTANPDVSFDTDTTANGNQSTLTFTTSNWNQSQTVTVKAAEDDDADDDTATIVLSASGGGHDSATRDMTVSVADNDSLTLKASTSTLNIIEGGNGTLTVRLTAQPSGTLSASLENHGTANPDITLDDSSHDFNASNWETAWTVTVSAAEDNDNTDDSATYLLRLSSNSNSIHDQSISVSVLDNDTQGLALSSDDLRVAEGASETFTVRLTKQPTGDVTVTLSQSGTGNPDITFDTDTTATGNQNTLTFTTSNWNTTRTVSVSAAEDGDGDPDTASITLNASGADYNNISKSLSVSVADNDPFAIALSSNDLGVNEGESGTFTVRLNSPPSGDVRVTVAQSGTANPDISASPASLTFTTSNWNVAQPVTVSTADDPDAIADSATLVLSASGGGYDGSESRNVNVAVTDNDTPGLIPSLNRVSVDEGNNSTFTVSLATEPSGDVTVNLSQKSDTVNADLTVDKSSLTFTTSNWITPQAVTVSAAEDSDTLADSTTYILSATGGGYDSITGNVTVTATDNDAANLTLSSTSVNVDEGESDTFDVRLATPPTGDVTVTLSQRAPVNSDVTLNQSSLTFTTSNWSVAQRVTVMAADDDDGTADSATIDLSASGGGYDNVTRSVGVTVTDDDGADLTLSSTDISVPEGGVSNLTVRLSTRPSANVKVKLTQSGTANPDVSFDTDLSNGSQGNQDELTFTASNWDQSQTVAIIASQDVDAENDSAMLLLTASGGNYASVTKSVKVTVTDDDKDILTISSRSIDVGEGSNNTFTVKLATQPTSNVTVTVSQGGTGNLDVSFDTDENQAGNQDTLNFTTSNWDQVQTVKVRASEDDDAITDSARLVLETSGGSYDSAIRDVIVTVRVTENDMVGLTLSPVASLGLTEGGNGTFTVRLATQPSADVTVTVSQSGTTNSDVNFDTDGNSAGDQDTLTFTTSNWNVARAVVVRASEDADTANDSATLGLTASGADYGSVTGSITVTVTDNDTANLTVSSSDINMNEGASANFTVQLATLPTGNVTVTVAQGDPANSDVTIDTDTDVNGNQNTLTFTTSNWNQAQPVMVRAADDDDAIEDKATLTVSASGGGYGSAADVAISVKVSDGDTRGLSIAQASDPLAVDEGGNATFTVKLDTRPSANVGVVISQSGTPNTDISIDTDTSRNGNQGTLTFTTSNWNQARTVTVIAADDHDSFEDSANIQLFASGADYDSVTDSLRVVVTDDDTAGLTLPTNDIAIGEGSTATFDVKLSTQPSANVTVTLTQPSNTDIKLDTDTTTTGEQNTLTFTTSNWNATQAVTINAAEDADADDETATISVSASGGGYVNVGGTVGIDLMDDDAGTLTLPSSAVALTEGNTATFDVRLSAQPTASVTVTLAQPSNTDVKVDTDTTATGEQNTLTFTTSDWNTAQTVTLSAAEDNDTDDESTSISVSASGGGYGEATGTVSVDVTDDDVGTLTLPSSAVALTEGNTATFDVQLSAQPT
ncbi:hypothetical protein, partial [Thioalkalivibrio sp. HK1]|uniref:hypothetical protein n=1 Tax=Thioalkalivibrio sp. HK1 TaxID=1469245 RepID=UPI00056F84F8